MATTVTVTGSGYPRPSADRAGPGVFVRTAGSALQFDAGRSTVQRLTALDVHMAELDAVFVTHHHSDHLIALADVVLTRWTLRPPTPAPPPPLPVICPEGPAVRFLERMLEPWEYDISVRLEHFPHSGRPAIDIQPFSVVDGGALVWERDDVTIRGGPVRHDPVRPAVGYRIETDDGVVAISGDTLVCDEVGQLADRADVLVHEAMLFEHFPPIPEGAPSILDYHADSRLIGSLAARANVRTLILTHLIPEPTTNELRVRYENNVRAGGFEGEVIVANDLDSVTLGG